MADKYTQDQINDLGKKGHAFKNDDGTYSYPIDDAEDLKSAIRAVGRGNSDHDSIRKYIIGRADDLDEKDLIPDNWNADGSLQDAEEKGRVWATQEQRDTATDVFTGLDGAVADACSGVFPVWCVWVQDWYGSGTDDDPWMVVYHAGDYDSGALYACPFTYDDNNKIVIDIEDAVKVRTITIYIDRKHAPGRRRGAAGTPAAEHRRTAREEMRGVRETRQAPITEFEIREVPNGTGGTDLHFEGYASVTCSDYDDRSNSYEMEDYIGPWIESMVSGCFTRTIREGCDTCFVVNHTGVSMARTKPGSLKLAEDSTGLHVDARLNPVRSDVQILRAAVDDGAIDEMSFAFQVMRQRWSYLEENGDIDRRWIIEVSLNKGDVSPVNYGANPHTGGLVSMRSAAAVLSGRGVTHAALAAALQEIRSGEPVTDATLELLSVLDLMDSEQRSLAELLGLTGQPEPEPAPEPAARADVPLILPDHTTAARAALAAARR